MASKPGSSQNGGSVGRRSFIQPYKPGQGIYVRRGTIAGCGIIVLAGANFVWEQLEIFRNEQAQWTMFMQAGVTLLFLVGLGYLSYWATYVNRRSSDFLIATEGEMKKVSWSTRREVIGSTKVVIMFTLMMAAALFVVDLTFMTFFAWINVLRSAPSIVEIFGGGGG
jgi:preprotein translocase subunit SecE